jgi:hypothetical protein
VPVTTFDEATIQLSPDGPWRRRLAPGITTPGLVYELMPGLWVWLPTEEDIPNGITWVLNEADLPIIEAYLQARLVTSSDHHRSDQPRPAGMGRVVHRRRCRLSSALEQRLAEGRWSIWMRSAPTRRDGRGTDRHTRSS